MPRTIHHLHAAAEHTPAAPDAWVALVAISILMTALCGCHKRERSSLSTSSPAPATSPTAAPATRGALSFLSINDRVYQFPPARLHVLEKEGAITLVVFSEDPVPTPATSTSPATTQSSALVRGNSFYFQMPLSIADLDDLPTARWQFKHDPEATSDLPDGIHAEGIGQVSPMDVTATFERSAGGEIAITLNGQFADLGSMDGDMSPKFTVFGRLIATPE